ncbi:MAG: hypothetical protein ACYTXA_18265 [Nostoc sp.]
MPKITVNYLSNILSDGAKSLVISHALKRLQELGRRFKDFQQINYPILWGGHLARL